MFRARCRSSWLVIFAQSTQLASSIACKGKWDDVRALLNPVVPLELPHSRCRRLRADIELGAGPEAARDVGQAMATNPVALIIPCHRVLAAGGKVGGFSAPGGSAAKIRMLALEGVHLEPAPPAQQSFGF